MLTQSVYMGSLHNVYAMKFEVKPRCVLFHTTKVAVQLGNTLQ